MGGEIYRLTNISVSILKGPNALQIEALKVNYYDTFDHQCSKLLTDKL